MEIYIDAVVLPVPVGADPGLRIEYRRVSLEPDKWDPPERGPPHFSKNSQTNNNLEFDVLMNVCFSYVQKLVNFMVSLVFMWTTAFWPATAISLK